ncbi:hypothetical protein GCM10022393_16170 [Aquimarina addita]|uniref:DUF4296 domain-containing protein n=2 Tax=Aquimarina addita TaxID=870485 RepID=A0ABP7XGL5_9FLAO
MPENLIEEEQMIDILKDIAFVKAAKSSYRKVFELENIDPEAYILRKYNIDSLTFAENNHWYASQLKTYDRIFRTVKDTLEYSKNLTDRLRKQQDSLQKVYDSIYKQKDGEDTISSSVDQDIREREIEENLEEIDEGNIEESSRKSKAKALRNKLKEAEKE